MFKKRGFAKEEVFRKSGFKNWVWKRGLTEFFILGFGKRIFFIGL